MDIHEYQAKEILSRFGVPIAPGGLARTPGEAAYRATELGGDRWAVKAQVHAGARGKAGGIKLCTNEREVWDATDSLIGGVLVTNQTGARGREIHSVYVEQACNIKSEYYLGLVLNRSSQKIMVVASAEGGMDIEEVSEKNPDALVRVEIEPAVGMQAFQARNIAFRLGIPAASINKAVKTIMGCYRAFRDLDATMVEINPMVITGEGRLMALDAKMAFDDNALFRNGELGELRDRSQEDPRETLAGDHGLSYVGLDGDIGCIINGAGLAMATLDMIQLSGGEPANFLDIGGGASPERVAKSFSVVLSDSNVKAILVNIFAGINRCDWVAEGVVQAFKEVGVKVPTVVRLSGTNVEKGQEILANSGLPIITADTLAEAAEKAVAASSGAN